MHGKPFLMHMIMMLVIRYCFFKQRAILKCWHFVNTGDITVHSLSPRYFSINYISFKKWNMTLASILNVRSLLAEEKEHIWNISFPINFSTISFTNNNHYGFWKNCWKFHKQSTSRLSREGLFHPLQLSYFVTYTSLSKIFPGNGYNFFRPRSSRERPFFLNVW